MLPVHRSPAPVRLRPRRRRHQPRRRRARTLAAVALVAAISPAGCPRPLAAAPRPADQAPGAAHAPPVDAPIADPFRPPAGPYAAGNRGIEYDTQPGDEVRASADGTVSFAGPVAGGLHVTVSHADGVRTSYSFLAEVAVARGQHVRRGDRVGTAGERLHFGARAGDDYFDPAALFTGSVAEVELLPFEVPPGSSPDAEARALAHLVLDDMTWRSGLPSLDDTVRWLRDGAHQGLAATGELSPLTRGVDLAADLADAVLFAGPCSTGPPPVRPVAGQRRVAVTVAGLGSSNDDAAIDGLRTDDLGYDGERVVRFSYNGGRTAATGAAFPAVAARGYGPADTQRDVVAAAQRLADLLEDVASADPAAMVDVYAHSLGGVVTRLALLELDRRGADLGRLGVVITLATPHQGADAATAATGRLGSRLALDVAASLVDIGPDPGAPAIGQLSERSTVVTGLGAAGVPGGVRVVSIAARGDLVVAAPHTEVVGADNVTVPVGGLGAHSDLVASDAATAEMARALAGRPPGCERWHDAVADVVVGHAISGVEDHIGAAAGMPVG